MKLYTDSRLQPSKRYFVTYTISKNPIDVKLFFMYKVSGEILKNETLIEFELFDQFGWTADDGGGSNL